MNRKKIFTVAILIILTATVGVAKAVKQTHQPRITWSSPAVYAGITSTTTVTKTLTFVSNQVLQGVSLEAVPEIAKFVAIQPSTFFKVPTGQPQTVRLTFSAPAGVQFGAYDGTIHVRVGSRTLPQTLKTSITYAVVPLPPDPGEAGKATTAGIDSDGDGVRDDVERWIALTYPDSARIRAALTQEAKVYQTELTDGSIDVLGFSAASDCVGSAFMTSDADVAGGRTALAASRLIKATVLNTPARTEAYYQADSRLGPTFIDMSPYAKWAASCITEPASLPN